MCDIAVTSTFDCENLTSCSRLGIENSCTLLVNMYQAVLKIWRLTDL